MADFPDGKQRIFDATEKLVVGCDWMSLRYRRPTVLGSSVYGTLTWYPTYAFAPESLPVRDYPSYAVNNN